MNKKAVRIEFDESVIKEIDRVCEKYGYSRTGLVRTFTIKCLKVAKNQSVTALFDKLEDDKWTKKMI